MRRLAQEIGGMQGRQRADRAAVFDLERAPFAAASHDAGEQAEQCLRGKNQFAVRASLNPDTRSGVVAVLNPLGSDAVARTELKAIDAQHTQVTQAISGRTPWDKAALDAMQESVRMDTTVCFAYK